MNDAAEAVFVSVSTGALTGVVVVLVQRAAAGQPASPPPVTVAVFTAGDAAAAVGVIGMMKLVVALNAKPAGIVQVTVWPAAVQPAGKVPMVRPVGMVSVIVAATVVAEPPVFWTDSV